MRETLTNFSCNIDHFKQYSAKWSRSRQSFISKDHTAADQGEFSRDEHHGLDPPTCGGGDLWKNFSPTAAGTMQSPIAVPGEQKYNRFIDLSLCWPSPGQALYSSFSSTTLMNVDEPEMRILHQTGSVEGPRPFSQQDAIPGNPLAIWVQLTGTPCLSGFGMPSVSRACRGRNGSCTGETSLSVCCRHRFHMGLKLLITTLCE